MVFCYMPTRRFNLTSKSGVGVSNGLSFLQKVCSVPPMSALTSELRFFRLHFHSPRDRPCCGYMSSPAGGFKTQATESTCLEHCGLVFIACVYSKFTPGIGTRKRTWFSLEGLFEMFCPFVISLDTAAPRDC